MNETRARLVIGPQANGARYAPDTTVDMSLHHAQGALAARYVTTFDLASVATVQALYRVDKADGKGRLGPGETLPVVNARVVSPYGTDHVVALITAVPPVQFRVLLHIGQPVGRRANRRADAQVANRSIRANQPVDSRYPYRKNKQELGGKSVGFGETGGA